MKGFRREDFARLHPGGALGRRLLTRVADVMVDRDLPTLPLSASMREVVVALARGRGLALAVEEGRLCGVFTPGDLTRLMQREADFTGIPFETVVNTSPKVAHASELGSAVVYRMELHGIMAMPVLDDGGAVVGVVHLHDLMRSGAA